MHDYMSKVKVFLTFEINLLQVDGSVLQVSRGGAGRSASRAGAEEF
jgi:hypothetical protein